MKKPTKMTLEKLATLVVDTIDELRRQMVAGFEIVHGDIGELRQDMRQVKRDTTETQKAVAVIKVDQKGYGKAIDSDAKTVINHEIRIKKLEHAR